MTPNTPPAEPVPVVDEQRDLVDVLAACYYEFRRSRVMVTAPEWAAFVHDDTKTAIALRAQCYEFALRARPLVRKAVEAEVTPCAPPPRARATRREGGMKPETVPKVVDAWVDRDGMCYKRFTCDELYPEIHQPALAVPDALWESQEFQDAIANTLNMYSVEAYITLRAIRRELAQRAGRVV